MPVILNALVLAIVVMHFDSHSFMSGRTLRLLSLGALAVFFSSLVAAQSLPAPSRTVFRCEEGGKIVYSDSPCLGAKAINVEPTRGVSKLSGRERVGNDVQREVLQEHVAEAIRPLSGMNAKQFEVYGRRLKLTPEAQGECRQLDRQMPSLERAEAQASGPDLVTIQRRLFGLRSRFRELGC